MNNRLLAAIAVLLGIIAAALLVNLFVGARSPAAVPAPHPPPPGAQLTDFRLPCGHPTLYGTYGGNTFTGTCTEGHQWAFVAGKWIKTPFP